MTKNWYTNQMHENKELCVKSFKRKKIAVRVAIHRIELLYCVSSYWNRKIGVSLYNGCRIAIKNSCTSQWHYYRYVKLSSFSGDIVAKLNQQTNLLCPISSRVGGRVHMQNASCLGESGSNTQEARTQFSKWAVGNNHTANGDIFRNTFVTFVLSYAIVSATTP